MHSGAEFNPKARIQALRKMDHLALSAEIQKLMTRPPLGLALTQQNNQILKVLIEEAIQRLSAEMKLENKLAEGFAQRAQERMKDLEILTVLKTVCLSTQSAQFRTHQNQAKDLTSDDLQQLAGNLKRKLISDRPLSEKIAIAIGDDLTQVQELFVHQAAVLDQATALDGYKTLYQAIQKDLLSDNPKDRLVETYALLNELDQCIFHQELNQEAQDFVSSIRTDIDSILPKLEFKDALLMCQESLDVVGVLPMEDKNRLFIHLKERIHAYLNDPNPDAATIRIQIGDPQSSVDELSLLEKLCDRLQYIRPPVINPVRGEKSFELDPNLRSYKKQMESFRTEIQSRCHINSPLPITTAKKESSSRTPALFDENQMSLNARKESHKQSVISEIYTRLMQNPAFPILVPKRDVPGAEQESFEEDIKQGVLTRLNQEFLDIQNEMGLFHEKSAQEKLELYIKARKFFFMATNSSIAEEFNAASQLVEFLNDSLLSMTVQASATQLIEFINLLSNDPMKSAMMALDAKLSSKIETRFQESFVKPAIELARRLKFDFDETQLHSKPPVEILLDSYENQLKKEKGRDSPVHEGLAFFKSFVSFTKAQKLAAVDRLKDAVSRNDWEAVAQMKNEKIFKNGRLKKIMECVSQSRLKEVQKPASHLNRFKAAWPVSSEGGSEPEPTNSESSRSRQNSRHSSS